MPVTVAVPEKGRTGPAAEQACRRGRAWLLVSAFLLALVLLLPLVPLVHPVDLKWGPWVLRAASLHEPLALPAGIHRLDDPFPPNFSQDQPFYQATETIHAWILVIGDRSYRVIWFKGRRMK
jgi:hypothetical protein